MISRTSISLRTLSLELKKLLRPEEFTEKDAEELEVRRDKEEEWFIDLVNEEKERKK